MQHVYILSISALFLFSTPNLLAQWNEVAPIPVGRHHPVTWGFDSLGYVATGTNEFGSPTKDVYEYHPDTDSWEVLSPFPGTERSFAIGEEYNGKGYLGFGASNFSFLNDLWEFDPQTKSWTELTPCPCAGRRHPAFIIQEGRLFVGLGDGATGNLRDWWEYNIDTDSWTQHPNLPGPQRHHPFQFKAGDHVYAGMGHGNPPGTNIYKDWYRFNINTNQWEPMQDFPGEARVAGTQFDYGDHGYVLSGDGDNHSFMSQGEFWKYDHTTDTWEELPPHPGISIWAPGSFTLGNRLYFLGGQNRQTGRILDRVLTYELEILASSEDREAIKASVFPNPVVDQLNVSFPQPAYGEWKLFNVSGQLLRNGLFIGQQEASISFSNLPQGAYLFVFEDEHASGHFQQILIKERP